MRQRGLWGLFVVLATVVTAGCVAPNPWSDAEAESGAAVFAPGWPELRDAVIRPGVQIGDSESGVVGVYETEGTVARCTSNFIFTSLDNRSLYLGTAAHCTDDIALGDQVEIAFGQAYATFVYSGYHVEDDPADLTPQQERDLDFALLRVDDAYRHLVHPAVMHYGGPAHLASLDETVPGTPIYNYGNSSARADQEPARRNHGCITAVHEHTANVRTAMPVIVGDSGSGFTTRDGGAFGVASRIGSEEDVQRGTVVVTLLRSVLATAAEAGFAVQLATWPVLAQAVSDRAACAAFP